VLSTRTGPLAGLLVHLQDATPQKSFGPGEANIHTRRSMRRARASEHPFIKFLEQGSRLR
jgi:hypothetical protein